VVPEKLHRLVLTAEAGPVTIELTADTFVEPTKEPDKYASLNLLAVVPRSQELALLRLDLASIKIDSAVKLERPLPIQ